MPSADIYMNTHKGYTLLFSVLVAALVLGVAVFILDVSSKQYALSASVRDSMYSFYAADSGIECVAFNSSVYSTTTSSTLTCGKSSFSIVWPDKITDSRFPNQYGSYYELQFNLDFGQPGGFNAAADTCADIVIDEWYTTDYAYHDTVQSRGYNHCTNTLLPDTGNPATVERALQLSHTTSS